MTGRLFTSESVTEGHPDKIADQISDSVLDALLKEDPGSRVAVETLVTTGLVHVAGEVTTEAWADIPTIVRDKVLEIGYDSSKKGFDGASCGVSISIGSQSPDIAQGVDAALEHREGGHDLLVVNEVGLNRGFEGPDNAAVILGSDGTEVDVPHGRKEALADRVWDLVAARLAPLEDR